MTWGEVVLEAGMWTIRARRMEAGKQNRVLLTDAVLAISAEAGPAGSSVFESGAKKGEPICDMSMTAVLRRMKRDDITVHGFRSTFRDWAGETTGFLREVIEAAVAHGIKDKAEAAYARSDLFEKRRNLMHAWASIALSNASGKVVTFSKGRWTISIPHPSHTLRLALGASRG